MRLVYGITASNEESELFRLLNHIKNNTDDSIVVQLDSNRTIRGLLEKVKEYTEHVYYFPFHYNFSQFKNILNQYCDKLGFEFVFQLDADEMISNKMIENVKLIIDSNKENIDAIYVPRINIVDGLTDKELKEWNWSINDKGYINHPDYQGRIYRSNLEWCGNVHERICGDDIKWWALPTEEDYSIIHKKRIEKQEKQNNLYKKIQYG